MRLALFVILAAIQAIGCMATLPPHPTACKYRQLPVEIYPIPIPGDDMEFYCMNLESVKNLAENWENMGKCMTESELWIIQVEQRNE